MKRTLTLLALSIGLASCTKEERVTYAYDIAHILPDSLRDKKAQYIKDVVSAASFHMSAGDYEDPEDLVYAAGNSFDNIYKKQVEGLRIRIKDISYSQFVPIFALDSAQKVIFNELKPQR